MTSGIFLLRDGELAEMREAPFPSEDLLQRYLADHPSLLPGDQIDPANPCRWLLVAREMAVPGEEGGAGRWSLDHLFIDQQAMPTLVEVKRSSDTRSRREVVAQMLDYAANGDAFWSVEKIQSCFDATCRARNRDPADVLLQFLSPLTDVARFWQDVKTNLAARRIRLLFVADAISPELQRIVEFLNEQMRETEVLAVEIKQFVGDNVCSLVPRVIGQTAAAQDAKQPSRRQGLFDQAAYLAAMEERQGEVAKRTAERILAWAQANDLRIGWGSAPSGSFFPFVEVDRVAHKVFALYVTGYVEIRASDLSRKPPFDSEQLRHELFGRINALAGVALQPERLNKLPSFEIELLATTTNLDAFLSTMRWAFDQIRAV